MHPGIAELLQNARHCLLRLRSVSCCRGSIHSSSRPEESRIMCLANQGPGSSWIPDLYGSKSAST